MLTFVIIRIISDNQLETCLIITINDTCTCDLPLSITISDTSKNQPKSNQPIKVDSTWGGWCGLQAGAPVYRWQRFHQTILRIFPQYSVAIRWLLPGWNFFSCEKSKRSWEGERTLTTRRPHRNEHRNEVMSGTQKRRLVSWVVTTDTSWQTTVIGPNTHVYVTILRAWYARSLFCVSTRQLSSH